MAWEVWARFRDVLGPGSGPLALAMERAPVTTRRANPADLFSPGIAAGLWIAYWRAYCGHGRDCEDLDGDIYLVDVQDWRDACLGPRKKWLLDDAKQMAELVALDIWRDHGVTYEGIPSLRHNAAEATLLGSFVASENGREGLAIGRGLR